MNYYYKGDNVEEEFSKDKIPIPDLPEDFCWIMVQGGSKIRNLLTVALKEFKTRAIIWTGSGAGLSKAISCAEIVKRRCKNVHQISKICYRRVEEHWNPKIEGLDPLVIVREIPTIHILVSKYPLNSEEPGYQAPGINALWKDITNSQSKQLPPQYRGRSSLPERSSHLGTKKQANFSKMKNKGKVAELV